MDLNHVSAFVRVVHEGSFTGAAKALSLPKSSISRSVAQLEQDLGVRLLHRTTRKIHLTDAGVAFHNRVSRALADIDEATSATADLQRDLRGPIRVTCPLDLGVFAVAGIVARFVRRHPEVTIEVRLSSRVVDLIAEGFDLAVRAGPLRDQSLIARRVGDLQLGLYASSKYVAREGAPKTIEELHGRECILLRTETGTLVWQLKSADGKEATINPRGAIASDDISFLKKAVLAGGGIALLPHFLCYREERAKKLVRILPEYNLIGSNLHVVYPSARYVPHRVVAFRDHLVKALDRITTRCSLAERDAEKSAAQSGRIETT
jgi:DNA-binding transcriptional LysR family regulator